jgi:ADP-ribosylglycohydrolase
MPQKSRIDRSRACSLGSAIGDALGSPLEGLSAQQVRQSYGQVNDYVDGVSAWRRKPQKWRLKGLYSDDTQQALVLAECLLTRGRVDPEWIARSYVALATPKGEFLGAHRGAGTSFRQVVTALEQGIDPARTGQESAGCGAAVRIAPLALYCLDLPEQLLPQAMAASLMTHRDVRGLAGAAAIAFAVRRLALGEPREPSFLFRLANDVARAEDWIARRHRREVVSLRDHRHALSIAIAHVESLLERSREQALAGLIEEANRHGPEHECRRATRGFTPACIPTCLYVLMTTDSLEEALIEIVNLGGDADTAGAMVGAMAGAHYGERAIPSRWLEGLKNRDGIALRAELLAGSDRTPFPPIPSLIETERRLSREEAAMREEGAVERQKGDDLGANRWWR